MNSNKHLINKGNSVIAINLGTVKNYTQLAIDFFCLSSICIKGRWVNAFNTTRIIDQKDNGNRQMLKTSLGL